MTEYVAILVYEGLIESVQIFDDKADAIAWIGAQVNECGADRCVDSTIWDMKKGEPIELAFAH
jgi:hypothetical protein